jgi:transcriptional regulator with XRE-family HTH domain
MGETKPNTDGLTALQRWRLLDRRRTYAWMAGRLGCSIAGISRIVRGQNMPRARLALKIQDLSGVSLSDMATDKARNLKSNRAERVRHGKELIRRGSAILAAASEDTP